jgi:hypothetical protein
LRSRKGKRRLNMVRELVAGVVLSCVAVGVHGQPPATSKLPAGVPERSMDVRSTGAKATRTTAQQGPVVSAADVGVTEDTVGDPYSFGRAKNYLGVAQTESITLTADCSSFPPDGGICIQTNPAPANTSVDEPDLAVIQLPGKATHSIICFTFTPFASWNWYNGTGSPQLATMWLRPTVKIESEVLDDPSLIDPTTGLPFNGVLFDGAITTHLRARTIAPGDSENEYDATTRSCTGGLVSYPALSETYGLSDDLIKKFFKKPITITFGVTGSVQMVTDAGYSVGVRLYGD